MRPARGKPVDSVSAPLSGPIRQISLRRLGWLLALYLLMGPSFGFGQRTPQSEPRAIHSGRDLAHPVASRYGMVATQDATATRIGSKVLENGGNAVDAAVAVAFGLAVTLPRAGNIGGGGFMLVHQASTSRSVAIDYREVAPAASSPDMFLGEDKQVDKQRKRFSHLSVGVPGTVAGLHLAHSRFGSRPWAELIAPAINLARNGITVSPDLAAAIDERRQRFARHPATASIFLRPDGTAWAPGERLRQSDLAHSLSQIAEHGLQAFYHGEIAAAIAAEISRNGGLLTMADLANYKAVLREPVRGSYRGHEIVSMPPPSSGGIHLLQMLNILEGFNLGLAGHNSALGIHLMAETMKLAYADRSEHLGDPAFWQVPQSGLLSKDYAASLRRRIDTAKATPSTEIKPGRPQKFESDQTTHFSIVDSAGNAVSNTYTLNFSFGSGIVASTTGILLNNEMDDFSGKAGSANAYGLIGGEANAVAGGKRPLSSMTPTLLLEDGRVLIATGSPGGSRIITTVLQMILNIIDHGLNLQEATNAVRVHHQWQPDELRVEEGLSIDTIRLLQERGHKIIIGNAMGSTQSVQRRRDIFLGASDPRRQGSLSIGPQTAPVTATR